jgi:hypothetical protein
MDQLTSVLTRFCKAGNIFIDPSLESIDLQQVFNNALTKGYISEETFLEIQACMK